MEKETIFGIPVEELRQKFLLLEEHKTAVIKKARPKIQDFMVNAANNTQTDLNGLFSIEHIIENSRISKVQKDIALSIVEQSLRLIYQAGYVAGIKEDLTYQEFFDKEEKELYEYPI